MNILATADLHLGKQSSNVSKELPESSATYTLNRMFEYAIDEDIDALLLAGDVVDRDNRYFEAIGPVQKAFERLGEAGIPVVMVSGNHDYDVLPDIVQNQSYPHVHLLGEKGRWEAKTVDTKAGKLQVVGWSFPNQYVTEDPLLQFSVNSLKLDPNLPSVGLLHGDLYDRKSQYAPLNLSDFPADGPHVWVIGHIHKPDVIRSQEPKVFYPGSPQALSAKEPGVHGPTLLSFDGSALQSEQIPLSPVRYELIRLDVNGIENESDFRTHLTQQMREFVQTHIGELEHVSHVVCDIELTGKHHSLNELDNWSHLADQLEQQPDSDTLITVRKVVNLAQPVVGNLEELAQQPTPPGMLAKLILDLESGQTSGLSESIVAKHKKELSRANRSATYRPLSRFDNQVPDTDDASKEILLRESRQLLSELLSQQEEK